MGEDTGRDHLVLSTGAWTCQRAVRFERYICIKTYHDGYHEYPEVMLFDLVDDPHEERNLANDEPALVQAALAKLENWQSENLRHHPTGVDPMWTVMREGGPWHVRGQLKDYLQRLRDTERSEHADRLEAAHPGQF